MDIIKIKEEFPEFLKPLSKNCIDLTNKKFGRLQVLYRFFQNTPQGQALWVCQCDCGKIKPIRGSSLRNGTATSCGCLTYENASKANINNLVGKRFGKLTVLQDTKKRKNHRVIWLCQCDCGEKVERISDSLIQGDTCACGHCNSSIGVTIIEKILKENNIIFEREKTFSELRGKKGMPLRYDFYLPEYNRLIEYDGIQHFEERDFFKDSLIEIQKRDKIKNDFALKNNIDLVRIPYWKNKSITLDTLLKNNFLVGKDDLIEFI